jgi:hypothetical protein
MIFHRSNGAVGLVVRQMPAFAGMTGVGAGMTVGEHVTPATYHVTPAHYLVTPAEAGVWLGVSLDRQMPACAGMTGIGADMSIGERVTPAEAGVSQGVWLDRQMPACAGMTGIGAGMTEVRDAPLSPNRSGHLMPPKLTGSHVPKANPFQ